MQGAYKRRTEAWPRHEARSLPRPTAPIIENINPICYSLPVYISFKGADEGILFSSSFLYMPSRALPLREALYEGFFLIDFYSVKEQRDCDYPTIVACIRIHGSKRSD